MLLSVTLLACCLTISTQAAIERHYYDWGVNAWVSQTIDSSDDYVAITTNWDGPYQVIAARKDMGIDRFMLIGGSWQKVDTINSTTKYTALAWNWGRQNQFFASREDGGIDRYYWAGVWANDVVTSTGNYTALAGSFGFNEAGYAARADGGIDRIYYSGGWGVTPVTSTGSYTALSPIYDNHPANVGQVMQFACANTSGGIDRYHTVVYPPFNLYPITATGNYAALAANYSPNHTSGLDYQLFAAGINGGIDRVWIPGGVLAQVDSAAGKKYIALSDVFGGSNEVIAITAPVPEPASIIGLVSGLTVIVALGRRKR